MNLPKECMMKGHPSYGGGRPRSVTPEKEELIKLGEEMIAWIDEHQPVHLSQWYTIEKMFTYNQWKTMIQASEFFPYYEKALRKVGLQYLVKDSPIEPSIKQRWQRVYFKDVKEEEDEKTRYDAQVSKEASESNVDAEVARQQEQLMAQIAVLQEALRQSKLKDRAQVVQEQAERQS